MHWIHLRHLGTISCLLSRLMCSNLVVRDKLLYWAHFFNCMLTYAQVKAMRKIRFSMWMLKAATIAFACRLVGHQTSNHSSFHLFAYCSRTGCLPKQCIAFHVPTCALDTTIQKSCHWLDCFHGPVVCGAYMCRKWEKCYMSASLRTHGYARRQHYHRTRKLCFTFTFGSLY